MKTYKVIYSKLAIDDIDKVVNYITSFYRKESGIRTVVKSIHPEAKTLSIMNRRWTVVFHIEKGFVFVDRIIPSKMIKG